MPRRASRDVVATPAGALMVAAAAPAVPVAESARPPERAPVRRAALLLAPLLVAALALLQLRSAGLWHVREVAVALEPPRLSSGRRLVDLLWPERSPSRRSIAATARGLPGADVATRSRRPSASRRWCSSSGS